MSMTPTEALIAARMEANHKRVFRLGLGCGAIIGLLVSLLLSVLIPGKASRAALPSESRIYSVVGAIEMADGGVSDSTCMSSILVAESAEAAIRSSRETFEQLHTSYRMPPGLANAKVVETEFLCP